MAEQIPTSITDDDVLLLDDHLVIVNKPRGWPVHATHDPNRLHLGQAVGTWLSGTSTKAVDVSAVHRLDVWTSGVVLLARTQEARRSLAQMFENREVGKHYHAVCVHRPSETEGELRHYLARRRENGRNVMRSVRSGGKVALTRYRVIARTEDRSVVEFEPETGRTHQLRVQSAEAGWPILGDRLYGDHEANAAVAADVDGQLLHASRLTFVDPVTGQQLVVEAPPPRVFAELAPKA